MVFDWDIDGGRLKLEADNTGMVVSGEVVLGGVPVTLAWRNNFTPAGPFRSRYELSGRIAEVETLDGLSPRFAALRRSVLRGGVGVDLRYTVFAEARARLEAKVDLTPAALTVPGLGWSKRRGIAGRAEIDLRLRGGRTTEVPRIDIEAGDLKVSAAALYAADGSGPERIDFTRLAWGGTDLAGWVVARDDGGWDANVRGASLDLEPFLEHMLDAGSRGPGRAQEAGPRFRLEAAIRRVRLGDGRHIENVAATLVNDGRRWQRVDLKARLAADGRLAITVEPEAGARRALTIRSNDAGAALRVFDFYQNMIGGTLKMTGAYDDQTSASPLAGRLLIRDYRIIKAPALARLVSILAVTGIVDVLRGEGLAFSELATRFRFQDGVLKVICGKAAGTALGVTASGRIDTRAETVQIEGTVVPAYLINAFWGHIPVIGGLLTGGEEGGGVFAAKYRATGPIADPDVAVNPLTALAPGFLRRLFDVFDADKAKPESCQGT